VGTGLTRYARWAMKGSLYNSPKKTKSVKRFWVFFVLPKKLKPVSLLKAQKNQLFSQLVFFVAGTGLEPVTFGL
jgi:hypothetical protein